MQRTITSYPYQSQFIGALPAQLPVIRRQENWYTYIALLAEPNLYFNPAQWQRRADLPAPRFRRARAALATGGLTNADGLRLPVAPAAIDRGMSHADRRLALAWALYGPLPRRARSLVTGIDYSSRALSRDPNTAPPNAELATHWIAHTLRQSKARAASICDMAAPATVLAWRGIWRVYQSAIHKGFGFVIAVMQNRNLPYMSRRARMKQTITAPDSIVDWQLPERAASLPLYAEATPAPAPVANAEVDRDMHDNATPAPAPVADATPVAPAQSSDPDIAIPALMHEWGLNESQAKRMFKRIWG